MVPLFVRPTTTLIDWTVPSDDMSPVSRRRVLRTLPLGLVATSGCLSSDSNHQQGTPSPTASEREYANTVDDPVTQTIRNPTGEPAVRSSAHEPERDIDSSGDREETAGWTVEKWLVTGPADRDALDFAPATDGVEAAQSFLDETEFLTETLIVQQYRVDACRTVTLAQLQWERAPEGPDGAVALRLEYEDIERDENCAQETDGASETTGTRHVEATITRVPAAFDTTTSFAYLR